MLTMPITLHFIAKHRLVATCIRRSFVLISRIHGRFIVCIRGLSSVLRNIGFVMLFATRWYFTQAYSHACTQKQ